MLPLWLRFGGFVLVTIIATELGSLLFIWTIYYITKDDRTFSYYLSVIVTASCLAILILTRLYNSIISRILYYMVSILWGLLIYLVVFSVIYHIISAIHNLSMTWSFCIIFIPSGLLFIYGFSNSFLLETTTLDITLPNVKFPLKIVHISDLHLGPIYGKSHVSRIVKEIERLNPEFVMITGDLFDGSMKISPDVLFPFNKLSATILFVLGNHDDVFLGMEEIENVLKQTKIILLRNEQVSYSKINVIGIGYGSKCGYLVKKLMEQEVDTSKLNILLYHAPSIDVEQLEKCNIQLHLGGHTHGGQMFPLVCSTFSPFKYARGLHKSKAGKSLVHISVGTGTAGPSLRMFSKSTITLLTIHS